MVAVFDIALAAQIGRIRLAAQAVRYMRWAKRSSLLINPTSRGVGAGVRLPSIPPPGVDDRRDLRSLRRDEGLPRPPCAKRPQKHRREGYTWKENARRVAALAQPNISP